MSTKASKDDLDYIDWVSNIDTEVEQKEDLPWYRSIPNAAAKGLIEGTIGFGKIFGPLPQDISKSPLENIYQLMKILLVEL
jgi:hypothetical protein